MAAAAAAAAIDSEAAASGAHPLVHTHYIPLFMVPVPSHLFPFIHLLRPSNIQSSIHSIIPTPIHEFHQSAKHLFTIHSFIYLYPSLPYFDIQNLQK